MLRVTNGPLVWRMYMNPRQNLFPIGCVVTWNPDAPSVWQVIWTPGPMIVVDEHWHSGEPSEYALKFGVDGMCMTPGWILTVEYDADAANYYNPPLSRILGKQRITNDIHEKWLMRHAG